VDPGGEVTAIDSAGFGPINITKAVTITSPAGVEAGIVANAAADAIDINAGPSDAIALRGLTLNGAGVASNGIVFNTGRSLEIVDSSVSQFSNFGILLQAPSSSILIQDSISSDNAVAGVSTDMHVSSGGLTAVLNRVTTNNNGSGVILNRSAIATNNIVSVIDSASTNNDNSGFLQANSGTGLTLDNVAMYGNNIGLSAGHGSTRIGHSRAATNRTFDLDCAGSAPGSVITFGDNHLLSVNGSCASSAAPFKPFIAWLSVAVARVLQLTQKRRSSTARYWHRSRHAVKSGRRAFSRRACHPYWRLKPRRATCRGFLLIGRRVLLFDLAIWNVVRSAAS
jgi:hypothetical protein